MALDYTLADIQDEYSALTEVVKRIRQTHEPIANMDEQGFNAWTLDLARAEIGFQHQRELQARKDRFSNEHSSKPSADSN